MSVLAQRGERLLVAAARVLLVVGDPLVVGHHLGDLCGIGAGQHILVPVDLPGDRDAGLLARLAERGEVLVERNARLRGAVGVGARQRGGARGTA